LTTGVFLASFIFVKKLDACFGGAILDSLSRFLSTVLTGEAAAFVGVTRLGETFCGLHSSFSIVDSLSLLLLSTNFLRLLGPLLRVFLIGESSDSSFLSAIN